MTQQTTAKIQREYNWRETPPSEAVIESIADYEEIESSDVLCKAGDPLYHYIDTDALDAAVQSGDKLAISFTYSSYIVHIEGDSILISSL